MAENDKQEQQKVTGNERSITVEIGHFPQDIDEATYRQIIDAAYQFSIQLPGHAKWPLSWRIDMQKWYQAAAAHFGCDFDFMNPWHDPNKELPPSDTTVIVVVPLPGDFRKYGITDTVCPSPGNRDPHAYYDKYGFEELLATPVAWAYKPDFPKWLLRKLDSIKH